MQNDRQSVPCELRKLVNQSNAEVVLFLCHFISCIEESTEASGARYGEELAQFLDSDIY